MRKTIQTLVAVALLGGALTVAAQAQDNRRGRGDDEFGPATAAQLAAADRRLNQIYQRRIADARADDRTDRRFRGWYSQENALRDAERIWINFRDAECRFLTQQSVGTRAYGGVLTQCLLDRTQERTEALREAQFAQR